MVLWDRLVKTRCSTCGIASQIKLVSKRHWRCRECVQLQDIEERVAWLEMLNLAEEMTCNGETPLWSM